MPYKKETRLIWVNCVVVVCVTCRCLMLSLAGLQFVIVAFPGHIYLLLDIIVCFVTWWIYGHYIQ